MSAYVIALVSTSAITAAGALVALTAVMGHRRRLAAPARDPRLQQELAEVQRQIDQGRRSF
ncbi:hypothetical protein PX701_09535 [Agromyces sp. H3Y2-19a]|uniref:hypothetical protein n=1 Tax=Agromyces TaxID=33877 RepID=UPI001E588836|nr:MULTISPECIES: hypothetical protein [Agromyces]MCD5344961.1 hypothetical protein [Agromyces sp. S2-1-8]MDF0513861.1 hypothetical protein [Agromyces chromiiresistens]